MNPDIFLAAQAPIYPTVAAELEAGRKRTHWMWFIFPQLRGLGTSERAIRYGLADIDEARAYLAHPVLGQRLRECTLHVLFQVGGVGIEIAPDDTARRVVGGGRTAHQIFGSPDDLKFRSSMTLFSRAAPGPDGTPFRMALTAFFDGKEDERTIALLGLT